MVMLYFPEGTYMKIRFWGVRGSIPTPHTPDTVRQKITEALRRATVGDLGSDEAIGRFIDTLPFSVSGTYGGNTTCIEVRPDNGDVIIIDCGSGLKNLGKYLLHEDFGQGRGFASILMTHTHWDHVQGIPFFVPFYIPGNSFTFYSPLPDMRERIEYQQDFSHFPVNLDYMLAHKEFIALEREAEFFLNDVCIVNKRMRHPGAAFGYRIEDHGKVFVFTSDCEFNIDEMENIDSYASFFSGADVLVFDTQYTFEESVDKIDWGHSSASVAIDIAIRFGAKKLILYHHNPDYTDEKLDSVLANAKSYITVSAGQRHVSPLEIDLAYEGMELTL